MSPRSSPLPDGTLQIPPPSSIRFLSFVGRYCMYVFFTVDEHNFWACSGLDGKLDGVERD